MDGLDAQAELEQRQAKLYGISKRGNRYPFGLQFFATNNQMTMQ
jgi:hypothetical protein